MEKNIRPIAIYLPQFHPVPENDEWWGKGFTEWTNVTKAKPLFKDHYQPHYPADMGFYDLRLPEIRQAQADLAKEYGIYGFCYYHYWFNGKRILEKPFQEVFESGKPDFPFMLCWANENWTRTWDGGENQILLKQDYSPEDDLRHIQALIPYFKDPRYIRINNKPVFAIYRSTILPDIDNTLRIWREEAAKHDLELYLCRFESWSMTGSEYLNSFDAAIEFAPFSNMKDIQRFSSRYDKLMCIIKHKINQLFQKPFFPDRWAETIFKYDDIVSADKKRLASYSYKLFPCCSPGWDNTPRRKKERRIIINNTPEKFKEWFELQVNYLSDNFQDEEKLVFINAWNEWAEGNHLEPCQKWGKAFLEQIKEVLSNIRK